MEKSQRYPCLLLLYLSFFLLILADTHGDAPGDIALSFGSPGTGPTGLTFGDGYLCKYNKFLYNQVTYMVVTGCRQTAPIQHSLANTSRLL